MMLILAYLTACSTPALRSARAAIGVDALERNPGDASRRPQHQLGDAVLTHDHRLHRLRGDAQPACDVHPQPQGADDGAGADDPTVPGQTTREIREGIGRIRDNEQDRVGGGRNHRGDDLFEHAGIDAEKAQPTVAR